MPYAQAVSCLTLRLHQLAVSSCQVDAHAGRPCTGILHPSAALFECKYCKGRVNSALLVGYKNKHVQCKVTSHREGVCSAEEWKVTSPVPDHCAPLNASWRPSGFIGFLWAPPHPPPSTLEETYMQCAFQGCPDLGAFLWDVPLLSTGNISPMIGEQLTTIFTIDCLLPESIV